MIRFDKNRIHATASDANALLIALMPDTELEKAFADKCGSEEFQRMVAAALDARKKPRSFVVQRHEDQMFLAQVFDTLLWAKDIEYARRFESAVDAENALYSQTTIQPFQCSVLEVPR
jgi:hypothetical protein